MPPTGLVYWKVLAAFDVPEAEILADQEWRQSFPAVYERLDELMDRPPPEMGKVWIPYSMVVEVAKRTPRFFATNGRHLISTMHKEVIPPDYEQISALEALERYGPEHVFRAGDRGSSRIGKREQKMGRPRAR
jgi:hypothetical protein